MVSNRHVEEKLAKEKMTAGNTVRKLNRMGWKVSKLKAGKVMLSRIVEEFYGH